MVIGVISWRGDLYDEEKRMDTIFVYCARDDCRGAGRKMAGFRAGRILPDETDSDDLVAERRSLCPKLQLVALASD